MDKNYIIMAAPKGNQFWKIRSKHGRDKLFKTPDLLLKAAEEYFEWCESQPLIEIDFKGKDADRVEIPKMRAFTISGLCIYLHVDSSFWKVFKKTQRDKNTDEAKDFLTVITRIEEIIYTQKFTGAAAGFLNPSIIARDLGLTEKTDITTDGEKINEVRIVNIKKAPKFKHEE